MPVDNRTLDSGRWIRLGALLMNADVITPEAFDCALQTSRSSGVLLGTVLMKCGLITPEELDAALHLQSLVSEGLCPPELAIRAMRVCHQQGATPSAALRTLSWRPSIYSDQAATRQLRHSHSSLPKQSAPRGCPVQASARAFRTVCGWFQGWCALFRR